MVTLEKIEIRPSDVLLDRVLNPTDDPVVGSTTAAHVIEACGIIPDIFCQACLSSDPLLLETIADTMDEIYQFGGFMYAFEGAVSPEGRYCSGYEDDDDLAPLARFIYDRFELFVYPYAITALRDRNTREFKIGRFD